VLASVVLEELDCNIQHPCSTSVSAVQAEILVSFDIDGTLEFGDPPGPITASMVLKTREAGYVIGTSSDRPRSAQIRIWGQIGVEPDFVGHKHELDKVRDAYSASRRLHIGDTNMDRHYAELHGFEYVDVTELPEAGSEGWIY